MFPACRDPLLRRDTADTHCVYAPNRLAKVVWAPVQNEAPALFRSAPVCTLDPWSGSNVSIGLNQHRRSRNVFSIPRDYIRFIQHFGFSYPEYVLLLATYNRLLAAGELRGGAEDYEAAACEWLRSAAPDPGSGPATRTIYEEKKLNFPYQDKPELYIGGIFPITGQKYRAPELAKGKLDQHIFTNISLIVPMSVAQMAVEDVNADESILSKYKLVLSINDGKCEADVVMKRFIDIIKTKDNTRFRSTVGMLGPACSDTVEPIAGVSKHFRTVVISYSAEGSISSDNRQDYPYFFRTIAENKQYK